jgi:hypothetical protein
MWYRNPFCHSSVLIRRAVLDICGQYDENRYLVEDLDLWFRVAGRWNLRNLPEPLVSYRLWSGGLTSSSLRKVAWRSYLMRTSGVVPYGYHCPVAARIYSLLALAAVLLPARMVLKLFGLGIKLFGPEEVMNGTGTRRSVRCAPQVEPTPNEEEGSFPAKITPAIEPTACVSIEHAPIKCL